MSNILRLVFAGIAGLGSAGAGAADLVSHNGFEICFATAVTKPVFLTAMRNSIEGGMSCLPPQSGSGSGATYTACNAPNGCGTGVPGCPVTIHSAAFTGDFMTGAFTAPGTVNNIPIPITYTAPIIGQGSCTLNLTTIVTRYDLDYLMGLDGLDGVYSEDLATPTATIVSYTRTGCAILNAFIEPAIAGAITAAQDAMGAAIEPSLRANTVDRAVCPISGP
ncbi:MAG: hypothetical protein WBP11_05645 [Dokdonella sp.]